MPKLQITHQYKIWNHGVYLGLLEGVTSPFSINETINTAGAQIQVTVGRSADTASLPASPILDETGNPILDENGNQILDEGVGDITGDNKASNQMQEDNDIEVWEFSADYPNGVCVFQGYISKVKPVYGGDNNIVLTCLSNGQDLSQYIIESGDVSEVSQATDDGTKLVSNFDPHAGYTTTWVAQTFTAPSSFVAGSISIELDCTDDGVVTAYLYRQTGASPNPNSDVLLTSGAVSVAATSKVVQNINFNSTPTLDTSSTYYIVLGYSCSVAAPRQANFYASSSNPYANGKAYTILWDGSTWGVPSAFSSDDLYFIVWSSGGNVTSAYASKDTSFMLGDVMDNYNSQGGDIGQQSGGYTNSGQVTSYTFQMQNVLQGVDTIIKSLSPAGWWYYAEPSDSKLYADVVSDTPDFVLVKNKHIDDFEPESTKENIINVVYFTGGDDGSGTNTNIFVKVQDADSIAANRRGLLAMSDNRVNAAALGSKSAAEAVARVIAQNQINTNSTKTYVGNITVDNSTIDTVPMKIGKTIGFSGFGNFIDSLVLQIVGRNRNPDQTGFSVGTLPPRTTQALKDIQANLAYLQTVDNPATPS